MKKIILSILSLCLSLSLIAEVLTVTNTNDSGPGSLRRMIEIASNGDSIIFDKSLEGKTIEVQSTISGRSISINGGDSKITISGRNSNSIFSISEARLYNLIFEKSKGTAVSANDVIFTNCSFRENNYSSNSRAGIVFSFSTLKFISCTFEKNKYDSYSGGGILNAYSLQLEGCIFKDNIANDGGVIFVDGVLLNLNNCYFEGNHATAVVLNYYRQSNSTIINCTFKNNMATGVYLSSLDRGIQIVENCTFENNQAINGGAIYAKVTGNMSVNNSTFKANIATKEGGAIYFDYYANPNIKNCVFEDNIADGGGAIYAGSSTNQISLLDCLFKNNESLNNGGAILSSPPVDVRNCTFDNNRATGNGGGICGYSQYSKVTYCTFSGNHAENNGGACYISGTITQSSFSNNSSNNGGAIFNRGYSIGLKSNIFVNNRILPEDILNDVYRGTSSGYNVYMSNQNSIFSKESDYRYTGTLPLLLPLGYHGGNTPIMPINISIPEWNSIVRRVPINELTATTDQRGFSLPTTGMACAGAVEIQNGERFTKILDIEKDVIKVFPNPTNSTIQFNMEKESVIYLYDISGNLMLSSLVKVGLNEIDMSNYSNGVYLLQVNKENIKIIKNK